MADAAALTELEIGILSAAQPEVWVKPGESDTDAIDAAKRLEKRGLLRHLSGIVWQITPDGKRARELGMLANIGGVGLTNEGQKIIDRGGADGQSYDDMLLLEIAERAPGMSAEDLRNCFVAICMEYGPDALDAIRSGHVRFEKRAPQ